MSLSLPQCIMEAILNKVKWNSIFPWRHVYYGVQETYPTEDCVDYKEDSWMIFDKEQYSSSFTFPLFISTETLKQTYPLKVNRTETLNDFPLHHTISSHTAYCVVSLSPLCVSAVWAHLKATQSKKALVITQMYTGFN